jgi:hypothetical protein
LLIGADASAQRLDDPEQLDALWAYIMAGER